MCVVDPTNVVIIINIYSLNMACRECSKSLKECTRGTFQDLGEKISCSMTVSDNWMTLGKK